MGVETHLYLVRHGETDFNVRGVVQGRGVDTPLNQTGIQQAQALASRLADVPFTAIHSSPLQRAVKTAGYVAESRRLPITTHVGLEEMSWGVYEGRESCPEIVMAFEEMRSRWRSGDHDYRVEGGESLLEVQLRGVRTIEAIRRQHLGEIVLVVAHGRFLRILLASLLEEYGLARMEELSHSNTGVNHLIHGAMGYRHELLNCTRHLVLRQN